MFHSGVPLARYFRKSSRLDWNARAVAWSADQRITVVGSDYQQWIDSYWGVVLGNDPVNPQDDPDGDGASNAEEFIARTNPRDAASVSPKLWLNRNTLRGCNAT